MMEELNHVYVGKEMQTEGVIDVGLGGKMHDCVNLLRQDNVADEVAGADVSLDELVVGIRLKLLDVLEAGAVVQAVEVDNVVVRIILHQTLDHMRADEASASCEEDVVRDILLL